MKQLFVSIIIGFLFFSIDPITGMSSDRDGNTKNALSHLTSLLTNVRQNLLNRGPLLDADELEKLSEKIEINILDIKENKFDEEINTAAKQLFDKLNNLSKTATLADTTNTCDAWINAIKKIHLEIKSMHDYAQLTVQEIAGKKGSWTSDLIKQTNNKLTNLQNAYVQLYKSRLEFNGTAYAKFAKEYLELKEKAEHNQLKPETSQAKIIGYLSIYMKKLQSPSFFKPLFIITLLTPEILTNIDKALLELQERRGNSNKRKTGCDLYAFNATMLVRTELIKFQGKVKQFHASQASRIDVLFDLLTETIQDLTHKYNIHAQSTKVEKLLEKIEEEINKTVRHLEIGSVKINAAHQAFETKLIAESELLPYNLWRRFLGKNNAYCAVIPAVFHLQSETALFTIELLSTILLFEIKSCALAIAHFIGLNAHEINSITNSASKSEEVKIKNILNKITKNIAKKTSQNELKSELARKTLINGTKDKASEIAASMKFPQIEPLFEICRKTVMEIESSAHAFASTSALEYILDSNFAGFITDNSQTHINETSKNYLLELD